MYVLARTCMQHRVRHIHTGTYMLLVRVFYPYPDKRCFFLCLQVETSSDLEFKVFLLSETSSDVMIKYFSHRQRLHFFDLGEYGCPDYVVWGAIILLFPNMFAQLSLVTFVSVVETGLVC